MNFFSLFKRKLIYKFKKKTLIDNDNLNSDSLDYLLHQYGSDKANIFKKNQNKGHGYSLFYEKKLGKFKNKNINILELGSYSGASAAAFAKYFPGANNFVNQILVQSSVFDNSETSRFQKMRTQINKVHYPYTSGTNTLGKTDSTLGNYIGGWQNTGYSWNGLIGELIYFDKFLIFIFIYNLKFNSV